MSAGGINVQQPIIGAQPAVVGGAPVIGAQQPAGPGIGAPQGALTSPAATTSTAYVPAAGTEAGAVSGGGLIEDGLPRTAAIAAGFAATGGTGGSAEQAMSAAAAQQVAAPGVAQAGHGAVRQQGPAAWSEAWAQKFKEAGVPAEQLQQLMITGANGADEATLQQMHDQVKAEIDGILAQFAHTHPEEFKKLRSAPEIERSMLAQVAAGVNAGQVKPEDLEELVKGAGKSQGRKLFESMILPMLPMMLIPGYGAIRLAAAPLTGGKDFITGEKLFGDPMTSAFTIMLAAGGAVTLFNHTRGAMQVARGHSLVKAGGDAALIAANEGLENLTAFKKIQSFIPGTSANKVFAGISRLDSNLKDGISALKAGSIERELAENLLTKWRKGQISVLGDPASKYGFMGIQPNVRGTIINRGKAMVQIVNHNGKPALLLDGRMTGKTLAAHFAAAGVDLADDTLGNNMLKSRLFDGKNALDAGVVKNVREQILGSATNQLQKAEFLKAPTALEQFVGKVRPGPLQDAMKAATNVNNGTVGTLSGWKALPKMARFGIIGGGVTALAVGGGALMYKMQSDAAKQAAAGQPGGAGGTQVTPELQAALEQFAALPPQQQQQVIQQQTAVLQQQAQRTDLTPEQQQQLNAAIAELELFMQVATGSAGAAPAGQAAGGAVAPTAGGVPAPATGAAPTFTAKGLGLAP